MLFQYGCYKWALNLLVPVGARKNTPRIFFNAVLWSIIITLEYCLMHWVLIPYIYMYHILAYQTMVLLCWLSWRTRVGHISVITWSVDEAYVWNLMQENKLKIIYYIFKQDLCVKEVKWMTFDFIIYSLDPHYLFQFLVCPMLTTLS